jgi:F420-0:gamma-glutamyl ligase
MKIESIKTRLMQPPQDDLYKVIDESLSLSTERSVVVVSSKVMALHQGRALPVEGQDKEDLVRRESEVYVEDADSRWRICLKFGTFLAGAGIDESNANNHYILLPEKPHECAYHIYRYLKNKFSLDELGVILADSHSMPLRYGTLGVAIGWYGFEPVTYFTGKPDLFGRPAKFTRINIADSLACAGVFSMGELDEQTPLCVITDIPHIRFADRDTSNELFIPPREDIYWPLLRSLYER